MSIRSKYISATTRRTCHLTTHIMHTLMSGQHLLRLQRIAVIAALRNLVLLDLRQLRRNQVATSLKGHGSLHAPLANNKNDSLLDTGTRSEQFFDRTSLPKSSYANFTVSSQLVTAVGHECFAMAAKKTTPQKKTLKTFCHCFLHDMD